MGGYFMENTKFCAGDKKQTHKTTKETVVAFSVRVNGVVHKIQEA